MEHENDIQAEHAEVGLPEDPVISVTAEAEPAVQRSSSEPKAAMAEVDPEAELEGTYLRDRNMACVFASLSLLCPPHEPE